MAARKKTDPFPFFGSGVAQYYKSCSLLVRFERAPSDDELNAAAADLRAAFRHVDCVRAGNSVVFTTDDTVDLTMTEEEAWARFAEETASALRRITERTPIVFAARELADEGGHDFDAWHARSVKAIEAVLGAVAEVDADELEVTLDFLAPYVPKRALGKMAPSLVLTLLVRRGDLEELVSPSTTSLVARAAAEAKQNEAAAKRLRQDIVVLTDRLVALALRKPPGERTNALAVAAACLEIDDACTDAQRVLVLSLRGALDRVVKILPRAAADPERYAHAVGTALAEAVRKSHRALVERCMALCAQDAILLEDPVIVANALGDLLARSRHEEACALARRHLEAERSMTPALYTNALLAFTQSADAGKTAKRLAADIEEKLATDDTYFATRDSDMRGSAHAWLALYFGVEGELGRAYAHLEKARAFRYPDFALLPNQPAFVRLKGDERIESLFREDADAAIVEKNAQIEKNPRDWWAVFSRGLLFHERGDLVRAIADYERTIELNPKYPDVYINLGNIAWTRDKDFAAAIRGYDKAIALAENQFFARQNRAEARIHVGDLKGAIEDATRALALQPSAHVLALRALAHARSNNVADARKDAKAALAKDAKLSSIDDESWRNEIRAAAAG